MVLDDQPIDTEQGPQTSQASEWRAVVAATQLFDRDIVVYSDCQAVVQGMDDWRGQHAARHKSRHGALARQALAAEAVGLPR